MYYRALCFCAILFLSCDFQPGGTPFTKLEPLNLDSFQVNLKDHPEKEIYLKTSTQFTFTVNTNGKRLNSLMATIDEKEVPVLTGIDPYTGTFQLNPWEYTKGNHTLRFGFSMESESGSLADVLEGEQAVIWSERTVIISTQTSSQSVKIYKVEPSEGSVKISWSSSQESDFQSYTLSRTDFASDGSALSSTILYQGSEAADTTFFDDQYLLGKSNYVVSVATAKVDYSSEAVEYEFPYHPDFTQTIQPDGTVVLKWRSLRALPKNFYQYNLKVRETSGNYNPVYFTLSGVSDTTLTFKPANWGFGSTKAVELVTTRKPPREYGSKQFIYSLIYGNSFPTHYSFDLERSYQWAIFPYYSTDLKKYFLYNYGSLRRANEQGQLIDSIAVFFNDIKYASDFALARDQSGKKYRINLSTLESTELTTPGIVLALASNGTFGVLDDKIKIYTGEGDLVQVIDNSVSFLKISDDAKYLMTRTEIFKWNGTQYELANSYSAPEGWNWYSVTPIGEIDQAVMSYQNKVMNYDFVARDFWGTTTTVHGPCNYDPVSGKVGCMGEDEFVILNPATLEVYKKIQVAPDVDYYYLLNNNVLCPTGARVALQDIP